MKRIVKIFQGFSSRISNEQNRGSYNEPPREPPPVKRHFEFERKEYPWMPHSGYQDLGQQGNHNVRLAPWGREFTDHAIESTLPSHQRYNSKTNTVDPSYNHIDKYKTNDEPRSIAPVFVERTITYGSKNVDKDGRVSYTLGDLTVGVTSDERRVYHVKYTHK